MTPSRKPSWGRLSGWHWGTQAAKELEEKNLPYPAVQELFALVLAAVTGEDAEVVRRRFRTAREQA